MIIQADKLIYGDSHLAPREGGAILVKDGRIAAVGDAAELKAANPDESVTVYENATVLPGLIDMHTHLGADGGITQYETPWEMSMQAVHQLETALKAGVTTVRGMSTFDGLEAAVTRAQAAGWVQVPRIVPANQALCITGGHGAGDDGCVECDGVDEVRKAVRAQIKKGARWIKLMDSEGWRGEEFNQEELDAIVEEAHRFHIPVAAHAGCQPSVDMCIRAGVDTIEHGTYMTMENALEMKKNGQSWTPTILAFWRLDEFLGSGGTYIGDEVRSYSGPAIQQYIDHFKALYDTGVRVMTGTDMVLPGMPALPVALEAGKMVEYGITPLQAIEAATRNGGDVLGLEIGRLQEGYLADLLVVDGDPSLDIAALTRVRAVYQSGKLVE